jgi:hypothetical protein
MTAATVAQSLRIRPWAWVVSAIGGGNWFMHLLNLCCAFCLVSNVLAHAGAEPGVQLPFPGHPLAPEIGYAHADIQRNGRQPVLRASSRGLEIPPASARMFACGNHHPAERTRRKLPPGS